MIYFLMLSRACLYISWTSEIWILL